MSPTVTRATMRVPGPAEAFLSAKAHKSWNQIIAETRAKISSKARTRQHDFLNTYPESFERETSVTMFHSERTGLQKRAGRRA